MEWTKVEVQTTAFGAEVVTGVLLDNNIVGAEMVNAQERVRHLTEVAHTWDYAEDGLLDADGDDVFVIFYVTKDERGAALLADVREALAGLKAHEADGLSFGTLAIKTEHANDKTWLDEWKKHFKPFNIGRVVIVPQWENYTAADGVDEIIFKIDPGTAFGTGQHQTTRLCILALQEYLRGDESNAPPKVLDIGCGSGILSIIALLLGAGEVFACDIDPAGAIAATKNNAALNGINLAKLQIRAGDALACEKLRAEICRNKYEVIVANIVADVVIGLVPFAKERLTQNGVFIASGIIDDRAGEVLGVFAANKMEIIQKFEFEGWVCIVGKQAVCA
ncbi:MAG: 50S ribosomal protein L11 methyltransferase [Defluviitaleaceae bacterium]|nr:50S ribosomal protein L11 methyltransferase [Defluviitaleaceae bacterium]MCL2263385.1 50S ribosomal protein L11 methyltransferase [Defluviitaleaceae bacterium]